MIAHRVAAGKEADTTSCWATGPSSRGGRETLLQPGGVYTRPAAMSEVTAPSAMAPWARRHAEDLGRDGLRQRARPPMPILGSSYQGFAGLRVVRKLLQFSAIDAIL